MQTELYNFNFPDELIAAYPPPRRLDSRLLQVEATGNIHDRCFNDVIDLCRPDDLLVVNNSKVIAARLSAFKSSSGKVEILIVRLLYTHLALASLRSYKPTRVGTILLVAKQHESIVKERHEH